MQYLHLDGICEDYWVRLLAHESYYSYDWARASFTNWYVFIFSECLKTPKTTFKINSIVKLIVGWNTLFMIQLKISYSTISSLKLIFRLILDLGNRIAQCVSAWMWRSKYLHLMFLCISVLFFIFTLIFACFPSVFFLFATMDLTL